MALQITFPEDLPVAAKRSAIEQALRAHQVVIVCGETGSGKTTQLPKICLNLKLSLGRGADKTIAHTQPRRLAATSTAKRIAQELKTPLGETVGFKIRFHDRTSATTAIQLMTDGILLAETQSDPLLLRYDTIIIDEAHERSLNIDFLLGYLRQLLPRRPDLQLIVTSATIDASRFAQHFTDAKGQAAPVIEVSGRLFPVEVRYRPLLDPRLAANDKTSGKNAEECDLNTAIVEAVGELCALGSGDILVFLPGEREIREAADALRQKAARGLEILPLFARLSAAEQERVFSTGGPQRVVLATNVAETSLTVPGIRYVVDTGQARVKRYSYRNKVEQLQIEPIAQASANQRAGRCGRVAAGVCIRLYAEDDFQARPPFTDPEILRSSLAGVILRMKALGLGDIDEFPFVEPPPPRAIVDGQHLLAELNAIDEEGVLTEVGRQLAQLPADPRIGRMILAARSNDCLGEILIIASGLAVQDPRERPLAAQDAADKAHSKFADERSDFMAYLKLWAHYQGLSDDRLSNKKLQQQLRGEFLSMLRFREWLEVHAQLLRIVKAQNWRINTIPAQYEALHTALLAGLLGNIGLKSEQDKLYLGARGIKFQIHPGSALARKGGKWLMAAELVETAKLYARCVAKIEPEWIERVGAHLLKKSYYEPHWEKKLAQVTVYERAVLYGLPVYSQKRLHYGRIELAHARELFIRGALVAGEWDTRLPFFVQNRKLMAQIEQLEHQSRRQDILVDDELIFAFYDAAIPIDICNGAGLERWWLEASETERQRLLLSKEELMRKEAGGITTELYPKTLQHHGVQFAMGYHFEPGSPRDGATMTIPLAALNQVDTHRTEWLVPGMLKEKAQLLLKSLPQRLRRACVPLPQFADGFCETYADPVRQTQPLLDTLRDYIIERTPARPALSDFRIETLPAHCFMNFKLLDEHGRQLELQRSLAVLRAEWAGAAQKSFQVAVGETLTRIDGDQQYTGWAFDELPELLEIRRHGQTLLGFPALVDTGQACRLEVFDDERQALLAHEAGLRRLFAIALKDQLRQIEKNLPEFHQCTLLYAPLGTADILQAQWLALTLNRACLFQPWPLDKTTFNARTKDAKGRIGLLAQEVGRITLAILTEWTHLQKKLQLQAKHFPSAVDDIRQQTEWLLPRQFLLERTWAQLAHYPRYLKAAQLRLDKVRNDPAKDIERQRTVQSLQKPWQRVWSSLKGHPDARLDEFAWQLQELRVSLFAQELRTPMPVSAKRLEKAWAALQGQFAS